MRGEFQKAHSRFRHAEPYVGLLIASGFFSWLGKQLKVFGELGWPEAVFLGVAAAAILGVAFAAVLAGWRYFRPILPQEAGERRSDLAPQPDLSPETAALRTQVQNTQDRLGIVEERLEKTTQVARQVYDAVHAREAAAKLTPLLEELDKQLAAPLPPHTHVVGHVKVARNVEAHILQELERISPPDREHYESKRDTAVAAVQQNAIYCTVKPGEEANFSSGEEKQSWHIAQAKMKALRQWLGDLLTGQYRSRMLGKRDDEN